MAFDWLGAVGAGLGIGNFISGSINTNKAIKAQREENEKNRQYNWRVMQYQNDQYLKNRDNERLYNDPSAVGARLERAGLNRDLVYGSGGSSLGVTSQNTGVAAPAYSDPSQVGSLIAQRPQLAQSVLAGLQAANIKSVTEKTETETDKMKGEITSLTLDNIRKAATNGSMIELDNMQVTLAKSTLKLNDAQLSNLNQMLSNLKTTNDQLNADIDLKRAQASNIDSTTLLNRISANLSGPRFEMEVKRFQQELRQSDSSINLSNAQAKRILLTTLAEKMNIAKIALDYRIKRTKEAKPENAPEILVIEGDQQTDNDANRIRETGARAIQINTGKGCHLDAEQVKLALQEAKPTADSLVLIENVGYLVCPAEFDLGEAHKVVVISVTEGDDKPLKYPDMFAAANLMIINKIDLAPYVKFDLDKCEENARRVNPSIRSIRMSATTGEGMQKWWAWLTANLTLAQF